MPSILADLETPTSLFLKLASLKPAFLLESVAQGEQLGRYSFIGLDPVRRIEHQGQEPLQDLISRELAALPSGTDAAHRLCNGLVGVIGYDAVHELLPTRRKPRPSELPRAAFMVPRAVLTFDHVRQRIEVSHREGEVAAQKLLAEVKSLVDLGGRAGFAALPRGRYEPPQASMSEQEFAALVARAKEHIAAGDVFQVVLSLAFEGRTTLHPYQVYRALRHLNPSPYLYFLDFGDYQVIGSSPEALVRLENGEILIRPIAGTRPRGRDAAEDGRLAEELVQDEKENAEHNMLVDLARNDVGRVAAVGSVRVAGLRSIERYSHVMHLVSTVTGRRSETATTPEVFRSAFPAGTVSGAPKVRACQIIDDLEPRGRGFYAGSVGYFSALGDMDQAICIRTIVMHQGRYRVQAGAGIVADSRAADEYQEIRNKAAGLLRALEFAATEL
ncbi:anthranilate synthase component I [bacterium]|nr:MAG: anthranilate synthase component I [bacterium]RIK62336.1 MAG: anthranilate synthase component I [Planctomycetota bacterium]